MDRDIKSFLLYIDQKKIIDKLSDEQAGKLFKYIYSYAAGNDIIIDDIVIDIAFTNIQSHMDRDKVKWEKTKERRSAAGKKGGRPKKENVNEKLTEKAIAFFDKQSKANKADNVNINDNVNFNLNENVNKKTFSSFSFEKIENSHLLTIENFENQAAHIVLNHYLNLGFKPVDFCVFTVDQISETKKEDYQVYPYMETLNKAFLTYIYKLNIHNIQSLQVHLKSVQNNRGMRESIHNIKPIIQAVRTATENKYKKIYFDIIK